jgi:aspartate kinase
MKFGGHLLLLRPNFLKLADIVLARAGVYRYVVVVVSAMGNTTDQLLALAKEVHPEPPRREQDMLISVGERVSIALLAMALAAKGKEAISFTGSQSGIITTSEHADARIVEIRPQRILKELAQGKIVIVAGFQGMSKEGEITTLGRGGSDTTAVALGVALRAEKVEFYKDIPGVFSEDPKKSASFLFPKLTYEEALHITMQGAKVLHHRCVSLALKNKLPLHILPFEAFDTAGGTLIGELPRSIGPLDSLLFEGDTINGCKKFTGSDGL